MPSMVIRASLKLFGTFHLLQELHMSDTQTTQDTTKNGVDPIDVKIDLLLQTVEVMTQQLSEVKDLLDELYERVDELDMGDGFNNLEIN